MFTTVHLHLLLNHLPIIITALGLVLVGLAAWRRDDSIARVAFAFFVGGAISALPTYLTGEASEDAVINLPGVTEALIDGHKEIAFIAAIVVGALGAFALWALWRHRRPAQLPHTIVRLALAGALVSSGLMAYTGLLGGQIRHTEVRPGFVVPVPDASRVSGLSGGRGVLARRGEP